MTYKEFIEGIRDGADCLEHAVRTSQVINLDDEMGEDDTIVFAYEQDVCEFLDNITGVHGHKVTR